MRFFSLNTGHSRIFGLDLLRAVAILFVVIGHSSILAPEHIKPIIRLITLDGVAIFFVLSGFLIGGILIRQIEKSPPSIKGLLTFWSRRWLRTLPVYFFLLTFVIIYTFILKPQRVPEEWYRYYLFIQNFNYPLPTFFGESWSLSIEEWFYLIVPVLLFVSVKLIKAPLKTIIGSVSLFVIFLVVSYRLYLFKTLELSTFTEINLHILRQVITRLDAIMFGVLAAYVSHYHPKIWNKGNWMLFVGGFAVLYALKYYNDSNMSEYSVVYLPVIKSIIVVGMLPFLSRWKTAKITSISKVITFISLISYSMYLTNRTIVIDILIKFGLHNNLLNKHQITYAWQIDYFFYWAFTIVLSYFLYISIETPFMQLRNRKIKE